MGQDSGMDAEPSWLELRDQRDMLREALIDAVDDMADQGIEPIWTDKARAALKEVSDEQI